LHLFAKLVDRDKRDLGRCNFDLLTVHSEPFGFDIDMHGYRSLADLDRATVKTDEVADVNRLVKDNLFHRNGHEPLVLRMPNGLDSACYVDIAQNNAAEYRAV